MPSAKARPTTIDEYLATVRDDQRVALEKLRKAIKVAAPKAVECIGYGLPSFRLHGKLLMCFRAAANHCALHPMSGTTVAAHQSELKGFATTKGTIRFQPDKPIPNVLVRKLVKTRVSEIRD